MKQKKQYISTKPEIMGGAPVITGTRIPIVRILFLLQQGHTLTDIHDQYPHVSKTTLANVIGELARSIENQTYGKEIPQV